MSTSDAILAVLAMEPSGDIKKSGVISGRTMLQKKMYFLSVLMDEPFGFRPHYYGPYSSQVSTALGALVEAGFVTEARVRYGVSAAFGEMIRFDYCLSESGRQVINHRPELVSPYSQPLDKINGSGVVSDINTISIAAKVHFVLSDQDEATIGQIRRQAHNLGWEISESNVDRVVDYLEGLNLVTSE